MHSKRCYKICTCSVTLGREVESFRNYKGFSIIFPENLTGNLSNYESENFFYVFFFKVSFSVRKIV